MRAVLTQLIRIQKSEIPSTYQVLAEILIESFTQENFLSSKSLAEMAFVSESSVTNFAKKLGYSGYRELITRLKYEKEHFRGDELVLKENNSSVFETIKQDTISNIQQIDKYESLLFKISQSIIDCERIFLFSSYQLKDSIKLFAENLMSLNKNVFKMDYTLQMIDSRILIGPNDLVLGFLSGQDNSSLILCLEEAFKRANSKFLITSHSQEKRLKIKDELKVIIDFQGPFQMHNRSITLAYILAIITGITKNLMSKS